MSIVCRLLGHRWIVMAWKHGAYPIEWQAAHYVCTRCGAEQ